MNEKFTLDQKLKAFEIAAQIVGAPAISKPEDVYDGSYREALREYTSAYEEIARLILIEATVNGWPRDPQ